MNIGACLNCKIKNKFYLNCHNFAVFFVIAIIPNFTGLPHNE